MALPQAVELAEPIDRTAAEEVAQLLGYDAADVLRIEMDPVKVVVTAWARSDDGRRLGITRNYRHVLR